MEYHIKLLNEETESLAKEKEICIFEDKDIKIFIKNGKQK